MFTLQTDSEQTLTEQIVHRIQAQIESGLLNEGGRLPSIRALAKTLGVSPFTVAEAYNRLSAQSWIEAKPARGYFVLSQAPNPRRERIEARAPVDEAWLLKRVYEDAALTLPAGGGWLPDDWLFGEGVRGALRQLARRGDEALTRYGHPQGDPALRLHLQSRLGVRGLEAPAAQIVLTHGASEGLDLAIRLLLQAGDTVLVESPGYSNLLTALRQYGVRCVSVPRTAHGPDVAQLAVLAAQHRPRVLFTNTTFHNPTGTTTRPACAFRVVQLAHALDFRIVEDDPFADLAAAPSPTLASLDGLQRVLYLGSFSKTISPALRVGFMVADAESVARLSQLKMSSGLTSSTLTEAMTLMIVRDGAYRSHLERLRNRLAEAQGRVAKQLTDLGWSVFYRPEGGLFLWATAPEGIDPMGLTAAAAAEGIALAPGHYYEWVAETETRAFRFNVAWADHPKLMAFLARHRT